MRAICNVDTRSLGNLFPLCGYRQPELARGVKFTALSRCDMDIWVPSMAQKIKSYFKKKKSNADKLWQMKFHLKKKISLSVLTPLVYKLFVPVTLLIVINMHHNLSGFKTVSFGVQGG